MNQLQTILNNLGNTGVYVIRQDTHEILYFNDRVRRVAPDVRLGMPCHELFPGECCNCPLLTIQPEQNTHQTVNYGDTFGDVVDIAATRITWSDQDGTEQPAFLISVTPHLATAAEQAELEARKQLQADNETLLASLTSLFGEFFVVNTYTNTYKIFKQDLPLANMCPEQGFERANQLYCQSVIHPDDQALFMEHFSLTALRRAIAAGKQGVSLELRRMTPEGDYHWCEMIGRIMENVNGQPHQVLLTFRDIHVLRQALKDALALAEQANSAKTDFLSRMSHDIRTPLNAIMGMSTIASLHAEEPARVRDCLQKIDHSSRLLLSLINEVLDMSKIENGHTQLDEQPFNLQALLLDTAGILHEALGEKGHQLTLVPGGVTDWYVTGDSARLQRILLNLLTNSIKYTLPGGHISVAVRQSNSRLPGLSVYEFTVKDDGVGMRPEFLQHVFDPFTRDDSAPVRTQGTGLGMPIVKSLVNLMHGDVRVESELGKGTSCVFTVMLTPVAPPRAEGSALRQESRRPSPMANDEPGLSISLPDFSAHKLLLAEDNPLNREITASLLEGTGVTIDFAQDGQQALERFCASQPGEYALILMDIQMPVLDGYAATRAIRALPRPDAAALPILAMTANAFTDDVRRARQAGMNGHISKPVDPRLLLAELARYLNP